MPKMAQKLYFKGTYNLHFVYDSSDMRYVKRKGVVYLKTAPFYYVNRISAKLRSK